MTPKCPDCLKDQDDCKCPDLKTAMRERDDARAERDDAARLAVQRSKEANDLRTELARARDDLRYLLDVANPTHPEDVLRIGFIRRRLDTATARKP